jgi:small subunit ribosomal protein S20
VVSAKSRNFEFSDVEILVLLLIIIEKIMAHHKSAIKRVRQTVKRRDYNRGYKALMKKAVRAVREAETYEVAMENFVKATSILDRCSAKSIIHKNTAANRKSSLYKRVIALKK